MIDSKTFACEGTVIRGEVAVEVGGWPISCD